MNIHLSKDLEQFVHDAVGAGLYAGEEDVIRDALTRLKQAMPPASKICSQGSGVSLRNASRSRRSLSRFTPITSKPPA